MIDSPGPCSTIINLPLRGGLHNRPVRQHSVREIIHENLHASWRRAVCGACSSACRRLCRRTRTETQHPRCLGGRHRSVEHFRLHARDGRIPHSEHRSDCQRRNDFHRLLRRAIVHGGSFVLHHGPERVPNRSLQSWPARRQGRHEHRRSDNCRSAEGAGLRDRPVRQEPPR